MTNRLIVPMSVLFALTCTLPGCVTMNQRASNEAAVETRPKEDSQTQPQGSPHIDEYKSETSNGSTNDVGGADEAVSADNGDSLSEQIALFEQRRAQIDSDYEADSRLGGNMSQMREAVAEHAQNLEALMDELYAYLYGLDVVDSTQLSASQEEWETDLRSELDGFTQEEKQGHRSGNAMGMDSASIKVERMNDRLDELFALAKSLV